MNRKENQPRLPQESRDLVTEQPVDELHLVYKVVLSLRDDVKDVNQKCDDLSKQVAEFTSYMIRAKTQEEERQVPVKIEALNTRLTALEKTYTEAQSVRTGRRSVWDYFVALIAVTSLIVSLVKDLFWK